MAGKGEGVPKKLKTECCTFVFGVGAGIGAGAGFGTENVNWACFNARFSS